MKKILALMLALVCVVSLAACVDDGEVNGTDDAEKQAWDIIDDVVDSIIGDENEVSFEETVIVDNSQIKIVVTEFDDDELFGPTFTCLLENKTSYNLMFAIEDASVNGFMCDPLFVEEVVAGKSAYGDFSFFDDDLSNNGINYIESVEATFRVYNSDDWLADDVYNSSFTLRVTNSSKNPAVSDRVFENGFKEQIIVDNSNVKIVAKDYDEEGFYGPTLICYIENKTDKTIMISMDDVSVNGFMCDPFWVTEISPGKKEYSEISWFEDTLKESKIETIESIEGTFKVFDSDDWLADDIYNGKTTITVK